MIKDIRIGNGFDVHKLTKGKSIRLCGLDIEHDASLLGHSDADVALHSLTDAILGALAKGDIGRWFPPTDPRWKNQESLIFLQKALSLVKDQNFELSNIDLTFICERPKIEKYQDKMTRNLVDICCIGHDRINIKATTSEKLGFTGREEGIAVLTSILLIK